MVDRSARSSCRKKRAPWPDGTCCEGCGEEARMESMAVWAAEADREVM